MDYSRKAHTALLDSRDWAATAEWVGCARSAGNEDTESSDEACLLHESTAESGLVAAVGSIPMRSAGLGQDTVSLGCGLVGFHCSCRASTRLWRCSALGRLSRAAFLNDRCLVLLDGEQLLFVDFASGDLLGRGWYGRWSWGVSLLLELPWSCTTIKDQSRSVGLSTVGVCRSFRIVAKSWKRSD